jgi:hypothetical protein
VLAREKPYVVAESGMLSEFSIAYDVVVLALKKLQGDKYEYF